LEAEQEHELVSQNMTLASASICDTVREMGNCIKSNAANMAAFFNVNSADSISGHLVHVFQLTGHGAAQSLEMAGVVLGQSVLIIGSFASLASFVDGWCQNKLMTCAGSVAVVSLLLSIMYLAFFFVPTLAAGVWTAAGMAGTGHLGALMGPLLQVVIRLTLKHICDFIHNSYINVRKLFVGLKEHGPEIVDAIGETGVTMAKLTVALQLWTARLSMTLPTKQLLPLRGGVEFLR